MDRGRRTCPSSAIATAPQGRVTGRRIGAPSRTYWVGGVASLSAAAFVIRDGDVLGQNITILEAFDTPGGSLDGAGSARDGYVLRGGRMLEGRSLRTFDLFASIPTLDESHAVTQEAFARNDTMKTFSKSRLVRNGKWQTAPAFCLSKAHT